MRIQLLIWLLFAAFSSYAQTPIVELLSKADSTKKAYTNPPAGYGSLYYNYHKAEWWKVENGVRTKAFNAGGGGGGTVTGSGTSNQIAYWSTSSAIGALNTTTYPSLTELSYVKGVTSAIQTQLGTKHSGSVTTGYIPKATGSLTLGNSILSESSTTINMAGTNFAMTAPTTNNSYISFTNASSGYGLGVLGLDVASNTLISNNLPGSFTFATAGARPLQIGTNNLPRITVLSGGNVGIGTNTPAQLLDVTSSTTTAAINVSSSAGGNSYSTYTNSSAGYGVGILGWDIAGNSLIGSTLVGSFVMGTGAARPLQIATDNTPRLTILGTGQVGIGDATPSTALDVNGTISSQALTSGRVPVAGSGGALADDADLTFSGSTLAATNIDLGTTGISGNRTVIVKSSTTDANLALIGSQGNGVFTLGGADIDISATNFVDITASPLRVTNLTSGRVATIGTSGVFQDDADLTFNGTTLTATNLTSSGTVILNGMTLRKGSATLNFPDTPINTESVLTITVTGAAVGDPVFISGGTPTIGSFYIANVTATNTVSITFYVTAGCACGSIDPGSETHKVVVHSF